MKNRKPWPDAPQAKNIPLKHFFNIKRIKSKKSYKKIRENEKILIIFILTISILLCILFSL